MQSAAWSASCTLGRRCSRPRGRLPAPWGVDAVGRVVGFLHLGRRYSRPRGRRSAPATIVRLAGGRRLGRRGSRLRGRPSAPAPTVRLAGGRRLAYTSWQSENLVVLPMQDFVPFITRSCCASQDGRNPQGSVPKTRGRRHCHPNERRALICLVSHHQRT